MKKEQPVEFFVYLKYAENQELVKQELEKIVDGLQLDNVAFSKIELPFGFGATTTQKTYEKLFGTKLEYKVEVIQSNAGEKKELAYKNWVEIERANVPEQLQDSIQHVSISIPSHIYRQILRGTR